LTFIDDLFSETYYQQLGLDYRNTFHFGQLFWTHAYYPHENLELFRSIPDPSEPTQTRADKFRIVPAGGDAFGRSIPLAVPSLKANEEFLVIRAKRRPVILLRPEMSLPNNIIRGHGKRLANRRCLVAQVFSLMNTTTGDAKFSEEFVSRVRLLEYPQFMFLPRKTGVLEVDSLLRLDECQSVFTPHLQAMQYRIGDEIQYLLRCQLHTLFFDEAHEGYTIVQRQLHFHRRQLEFPFHFIKLSASPRVAFYKNQSSTPRETRLLSAKHRFVRCYVQSVNGGGSCNTVSQSSYGGSTLKLGSQYALR